jgi:hypothetical protein
MKNYPYLRLSTIEKNIPEMKSLGVSKVARSQRGFLPAYRRANGNPDNLSADWKRKRDGFVARHLAQYKVDKGHRRRLALIAWAYEPDNK